MKIICVGRNYGEHIKELGNERPEAPVIFLKPDSALHRLGMPVFLPEWSKSVHYEAELVFKIGRVGKHIEEGFAPRYIDAVTVGLDLTARDLQSELKAKGLPWELSKGFDGSAIVGRWVPFTGFDSLQFKLLRAGTLLQQGTPAEMIYSVPYLISFVSQFYTLKKGDLIFTGTPAGVGPMQKGETYAGYLGDEEVFSVSVR